MDSDTQEGSVIHRQQALGASYNKMRASQISEREVISVLPPPFPPHPRGRQLKAQQQQDKGGPSCVTKHDQRHVKQTPQQQKASHPHVEGEAQQVCGGKSNNVVGDEHDWHGPALAAGTPQDAPQHSLEAISGDIEGHHRQHLAGHIHYGWICREDAGQLMPAPGNWLVHTLKL